MELNRFGQDDPAGEDTYPEDGFEAMLHGEGGDHLPAPETFESWVEDDQFDQETRVADNPEEPDHTWTNFHEGDPGENVGDSWPDDQLWTDTGPLDQEEQEAEDEMETVVLEQGNWDKSSSHRLPSNPAHRPQSYISYFRKHVDHLENGKVAIWYEDCLFCFYVIFF